MKNLILILLIALLIGCKSTTPPPDRVEQLIKTPDESRVPYTALFTTAYYKGAVAKQWIDDIEGITSEGIKGRKNEAKSLIQSLSDKDANLYKPYVQLKKSEYYPDSLVKQEINYTSGEYVLRTVAVINLKSYANYSLMPTPTAEIKYLLDFNVIFDKTIIGNFDYIKSQKVNQILLAQIAIKQSYIKQVKKYEAANKIKDSINLLNAIPINITSYPADLPAINVIYDSTKKP